MGLREAFQAMDTGRNGVVTLAEFKKAVSDTSLNSASSSEVEDVFRKLDMNNTETIQYSEFIAACIQTKFDLDEYRIPLKEVFAKFDVDNDGVITAQNLRAILGEEYNDMRAEDLIAECDRDKDGKITFNDFMEYLSGAVAADAADPCKD